ncbi:glycosyltransferase family 2 protein [Singulisphaera sp. PoT]|uniref:glycosyltransferase family 2 protein n=1 Tax=Singulisphaera sp. PoT TaxID=3411797 RepID=UPI003BF52008
MANASGPHVSIVIPCRNEARHIEVCLRSILAQETLPDARTFEVVIADGMSDDGTRARLDAIAATDSRVRVVDNPGRIVSTGLNAAIRAARGRIIIRVDAHTKYAPDYVKECLRTLESTGADNVGGPWQAVGETWRQRAIAAAFKSPFASGGNKAHAPDYEGPVDTVYLGCWLKETLIRLGLFDEELVRNQDDELNFRIIKAGGRIWQSPRIRSSYQPRSSLRALFRQYLQYGYWKVRVIQKHRRPASLRHLVPVMFVLGVCFGWLASLIHPVLGIAYLAVLGIYGLVNLSFSIKAAASHGWELLPILPIVFLGYQFGYGLGFALGIVDFIILRRGARSTMTHLTRATHPQALGEVGTTQAS